MAAKRKAAEKTAGAEVDEKPGSVGSSQPCKLTRLKIKNFRSIGSKGIDIALDDIVVLVGENNAGKSTVARAYKLAMCAEESSGVLTLEDFHRRKLPETPDLYPCIEIETRASFLPSNCSDFWRVEGEHAFLRERFRWASPGSAAVRETYLPNKAGSEEDKWTKDAEPFGAQNVRKGKRPKCYEIDAFADPDQRRGELEKLLAGPVKTLAEQLLSGEADEQTNSLTAMIRTLRKQVRAQTEEELSKMSAALSQEIQQIFPGYKICLDPPTEGGELEGLDLFAGGLSPRMGAEGDFMSTIDRQGAGAQRTLLWAVLRFLANTDKKVSADRGRVLLLDEPELCLHPSAVRAACDTLYSLAQGENGWQVMVTTHSPLFVDLARDHTTVIRLAKGTDGIGAVELFRSDKTKFDADQKQLVKLLNAYDPYVAEFFFGGRTVIVEGDTEYAAFRRVIAQRSDLRDVHVVRARGKYLVKLIAKILNQFGSSYGVLHDFDSPIIKKGKKRGQANPAWKANEQILEECLSTKGRVILVGACENFEQAVFGEDASSEKPYEAIVKLEGNPTAFAAVEGLLRFLVGAPGVDALPTGFISYSSVVELNAVEASLVSELEQTGS